LKKQIPTKSRSELKNFQVSWISKSQVTPRSSWHYLTFFPNSWEFLVRILHTYYMFLPMLDYKFLSN